MSNMIPFEGSKLPAHLAKFAAASNADDLTAGVGQGYPIISIKGKVFHLVRGEERALIKNPDGKGPATSLEVVILGANPHLSKVFYSTGYVEGSDAKPDCYSNDGVKPGADAENPQAKTCATCPNNVWGSKISENGSKVKACSDSRRIAIATPDHLNEPMMVRVPAASLKALAQFGDMLKKRGAPNYNLVITEIGFDYDVAHPALTFTPVGFLSEDAAAEAVAMAKEDIVAQIVGTVPSARALESGETAADAVTAATAEKTEKPAKPAKSNALKEAVKEADTKPKAEVKVEEEETAGPAVSGALQDEITKGLAEIDFDDE